MMDTCPRTFISSPTAGYGDIRAAVSRAIERAEGLPAGTVSPRRACLDGAVSCDGMILSLGAR